MNSKKVAETTQTQEWDRAEYESKTKGLNFTKDFHGRQEALMRDPLATVGERVMAWILRRSWGEYRLYAVKEDGEAAHQRDCVRELGLDKTSVSHAVSYFKARGYLDNQGKLLYPCISPTLVAPDPKKQKVAEYATFLADWKVAHSTDNLKWEDARSTNEYFRKLVRSEYKKSRKHGQTAPASLLEIKKIKSESSSSSAFDSSRPHGENRLLRANNAEEEDVRSLYDQFKALYPTKRFDEAESKPIFEGKAKSEQLHILERLQVYLQCDRWKDEGGQYIKWASNWLKIYDADPPPAFKKNAAKQSAKDAVIEEAKRRYAKYGRI